MAQAQYRSLTKRTADPLFVNGNDATFWYRDLAGFGVRVYPSGKNVFVVQTPAFDRLERVTLGTHGTLTAEKARKDAAAVIARFKKAQPAAAPDPAPDPSVADLAERYQLEYVEMHCEPETVSHYTAHAAQSHRVRPRATPRRGGPAQGHPGLPHRAARHAHRGQQRRPHTDQDVRHHRCVGLASVREQPVPGRAPLQGREPRAFPDRPGAPPAPTGTPWGAGRGPGAGPRRGGARPPRADRMRAQRDRGAAIGGCRPRTASSSGNARSRPPRATPTSRATQPRPTRRRCRKALPLTRTLHRALLLSCDLRHSYLPLALAERRLRHLHELQGPESIAIVSDNLIVELPAVTA